MIKLKFKFCFVILIIATFGILLPVNTYALQNENLGREITESEYENLIKLGLNEETIKNLDTETFEKYKDFEIGEQTITTKYFKDVPIRTLSIVNQYKYIPIEVTEEEYNTSKINPERAASHETTYKKITLTITRHPNSMNISRIVVADLTWKQLPANKSYDVFALYATSGMLEKPTAYQHKEELAPSGDACTLNTTKTWTTTYSSSHPDWNTTGVLSAYKGVGISMQLDTRRTPCVYDLGMVFGFDKGYNFQIITSATPIENNSVTIRASYQHAQGTVSLSASKNYQFSTSGYGGVILFNNSSTASIYDGMGGVSDTL